MGLFLSPKLWRNSAFWWESCSSNCKRFHSFLFPHQCLLHYPVSIPVLILLTSWLLVLLFLVTLYVWCVQAFLYRGFQILIYLNSVVALTSTLSQKSHIWVFRQTTAFSRLPKPSLKKILLWPETFKFHFISTPLRKKRILQYRFTN